MARLRRFSWPTWLLGIGAVLLLIAGVLYVAPSDNYIFLPDRARAVAPLVKVQGEKRDRDGGGIYYVAVDVRKASLLEKAVPGLNDGATLVPADQVNPEGVDERQRRQGELQEMARSQKYAAAVALRALGYKVAVQPRGALVEAVGQGYPAQGKLVPDDVVIAVDGVPVKNARGLTTQLEKRKPGDMVRLTVRRLKKTFDVSVRTTKSPEDANRAFLGVVIADDASVKLPVKVAFDLGSVGGPSAGLAFSLDLLEELGRDVDHGRRVAATGEILLDGSVRPVGGIKQKTIAARRSGMDLFLVSGDNAAEARRYADGLRIVPVDSFQQALRRLATATANA
jgi:PDZ domain-containing protein